MMMMTVEMMTVKMMTMMMMTVMKILMVITTREVFGVHQDGEEPVHCVKFSPDGSLLALGSRDNAIYTYQVEDLCLRLRLMALTVKMLLCLTFKNYDY